MPGIHDRKPAADIMCALEDDSAAPQMAATQPTLSSLPPLRLWPIIAAGGLLVFLSWSTVPSMS